MEIDTLFQQACAAIRQKDYEKGRKLLQQVITLDNQHIEAWLWYAKTIPAPEKRRKYIERALQIDPQNTTAVKMMQQLSDNDSKATVSETATSANNDLGNIVVEAGMSWKNQLGRLAVIVIVCAGLGFMYYKTELSLYLQLAIAERSLFVETFMFDFLDFVLVMVAVVAVIFLLIQMIMAFGQRLTIYENGIKHNVFGDERVWQWSDFEVGKVTNRIVQNKMHSVPLPKTHEFKLVLQSPKGKLVINDVFDNHVQIGHLIAKLASNHIVFEPQQRHPLLRWLSK